MYSRLMLEAFDARGGTFPGVSSNLRTSGLPKGSVKLGLVRVDISEGGGGL